MKELPPADPPRIVRPRKSSAEWRPVIAVSRDFVVVEDRDEDVFPTSDLGRILVSSPPSILVCQGFGQHLQQLQQEFGRDPQFNYRVTPLHRYSRPWGNGSGRIRQGMITDAICNWVGWKSTDKNKPNQYHYPLDPLWFLTAGIDDLNDHLTMPRIAKLYHWAREVRDWCHINGLKVTPSSGGIAAQLLRDSRFYPEPRRKVPRGINDSARSLLPGNYYHLPASTKRDKPYKAIYLDMENAHHALAQTICLPDPNSLRAYGDYSYFLRKEKNPGLSPRRWKDGASSVLERSGLFHLRVTVPHITYKRFPPPYMERAGSYDLAVYSNELQLIRELGGEIQEVYAAFVSTGRDEGIRRYARWSVEEIRSNAEIKQWLKPVLHSSYGLLAARPVAFETGYYRSKGDQNRVEYPMGNASIPANARLSKRAVESRIANVIQRGMIEAEVRKEALRLARFLTEVDGHRVLAIYADGIFIEDTGRPIKLLDPPWRVKETVRNLRFHSATTFTSSSLNRLPGIPRSSRERFIADRELIRQMPASRRSQIPRKSSRRLSENRP